MDLSSRVKRLLAYAKLGDLTHYLLSILPVPDRVLAKGRMKRIGVGVPIAIRPAEPQDPLFRHTL